MCIIQVNVREYLFFMLQKLSGKYFNFPFDKVFKLKKLSV